MALGFSALLGWQFWERPWIGVIVVLADFLPFVGLGLFLHRQWGNGGVALLWGKPSTGAYVDASRIAFTVDRVSAAQEKRITRIVAIVSGLIGAVGSAVLLVMGSPIISLFAAFGIGAMPTRWLLLLAALGIIGAALVGRMPRVASLLLLVGTAFPLIMAMVAPIVALLSFPLAFLTGTASLLAFLGREEQPEGS